MPNEKTICLSRFIGSYLYLKWKSVLRDNEVDSEAPPL